MLLRIRWKQEGQRIGVEVTQKEDIIYSVVKNTHKMFNFFFGFSVYV